VSNRENKATNDCSKRGIEAPQILNLITQMAELDNINELPEYNISVIEQAVKKQIVFIGSQIKINGLTMFEFNPTALTLVEAKYKEANVSLKQSRIPHYLPQGKYQVVQTLITNEGCVYVQALNKKNAFKKIARKFRPKKQ